MEEKNKIEQMEFVIKNSMKSINMILSTESIDLAPKIAFFQKEYLFAIPSEEFNLAKKYQDDYDRLFISILYKHKELCQQFPIKTDYQLGAIIPFNNADENSKNISHIYTKINKPHKTFIIKRKKLENIYMLSKKEAGILQNLMKI